MGEMLPVMLARLDDVGAADVGHLKRLPSHTIIDQVWITTSGIFSQPPFIAALQTFGIDRIMFSVDYPFAPRRAGTRVPRRGGARAGRHGEALPRQRRRAAEAEGVEFVRAPTLNVMPGLVPGSTSGPSKAWMAGTSPAMTNMSALAVYSIICFSRSLCAFGIAIISVTIFCIASPVVGSMSNFSRLASLDERRIVHHRVERLAQRRDALRRRVRRGEDRPPDVGRGRQHAQQLAILVIGAEIHQQRHVRQIGRLGEPDLHQDVDLLLGDPVRPRRLPRRPASSSRAPRPRRAPARG